MESCSLEDELMDLEDNQDVYLPKILLENGRGESHVRIDITSSKKKGGEHEGSDRRNEPLLHESKLRLQSLRKAEEKLLLESQRKTPRIEVVNQVVSSLRRIRERNDIRHDLSTSPLLMLFKGLGVLEKDFAAQNLDEIFDRDYQLATAKGDDEVAEVIKRHFRSIYRVELEGQPLIRPIMHSLGCVLFDMAAVFHQLYGQLHDMSDFSSHRQSLRYAVEDIHHFQAIMLKIIQYKYTRVTKHGDLVATILEEAIFTHFQPTLHGLYASVFKEEDSKIDNELGKLENFSFHELGVPKRFCLDDGVDENSLSLPESLRQYSSVLERMQLFASYRSPLNRINLLVEVCHLIDSRIKAFHVDGATFSEDINITSEDLAAILAAMLIHSPFLRSHIISYISIMDDFLPPHWSLREQGYSLTMLHTAIRHIQDIVSKQPIEPSNTN